MWRPIAKLGAPSARYAYAAVWTGTEMIIWGGQADTSGTLLNTGARYHPASGVWLPGVAMPPELSSALAAEVLEAWDAL